MKRVLITGGAGFIGFHLAHELLDHGYEVDLLDDFSRGVLDPDLEELSRRPSIRLFRRNLLESGADSLGTDYRQIYHLAAIIGVAHVLRRPYAVLSDNLTLLLRALDIARQQANLERFVFASTSEVYAGTLQHFGLPVPTPETVPITIPDLVQPRTSYMLSKVYGEAICQHAGIPFTVVRPHNFYGGRMGLSHVIPELLKRAYESPPGSELGVASMSHRRAFCYITDAVRTMRLLSESAASANQTLNVGNEDQEITIGELAQLIVSAIGKPLAITELPETPGSPSRRCPDIRRAVELTGFTPQVGLAEGIALTYTWYKERVFEGTSASAL